MGKTCGRVFAHQAVYRYLVELIEQPRPCGDQRLPSLRDLAQRLDVSLSTVQHAYARLEHEGRIRSVPRSGYYVNRSVGPLRAGSLGQLPSDLPLPDLPALEHALLAEERRLARQLARAGGRPAPGRRRHAAQCPGRALYPRVPPLLERWRCVPGHRPAGLAGDRLCRAGLRGGHRAGGVAMQLAMVAPVAMRRRQADRNAARPAWPRRPPGAVAVAGERAGAPGIVAVVPGRPSRSPGPGAGAIGGRHVARATWHLVAGERPGQRALLRGAARGAPARRCGSWPVAGAGLVGSVCRRRDALRLPARAAGRPACSDGLARLSSAAAASAGAGPVAGQGAGRWSSAPAARGAGSPRGYPGCPTDRPLRRRAGLRGARRRAGSVGTAGPCGRRAAHPGATACCGAAHDPWRMLQPAGSLPRTSVAGLGGWGPRAATPSTGPARRDPGSLRAG
ncbi:winged helix-turn-helix transcriptional regulator [Pseudomonas fulva]|nr:winged helix-turn-helix transcriptional regulator [Pseudomonas fulva]